jgi:hypothetical protein
VSNNDDLIPYLGPMPDRENEIIGLGPVMVYHCNNSVIIKVDYKYIEKELKRRLPKENLEAVTNVLNELSNEDSSDFLYKLNKEEEGRKK